MEPNQSKRKAIIQILSFNPVNHDAIVHSILLPLVVL